MEEVRHSQGGRGRCGGQHAALICHQASSHERKSRPWDPVALRQLPAARIACTSAVPCASTHAPPPRVPSPPPPPRRALRLQSLPSLQIEVLNCGAQACRQLYACTRSGAGGCLLQAGAHAAGSVCARACAGVEGRRGRTFFGCRHASNVLCASGQSSPARHTAPRRVLGHSSGLRSGAHTRVSAPLQHSLGTQLDRSMHGQHARAARMDCNMRERHACGPARLRTSSRAPAGGASQAPRRARMGSRAWHSAGEGASAVRGGQGGRRRTGELRASRPAAARVVGYFPRLVGSAKARTTHAACGPCTSES